MIRILLLMMLAISASAADIGEQVESLEKSDMKMCIDRATNQCIDTECLTSEARDCQEKCRERAKEQCNQELE